MVRVSVRVRVNVRARCWVGDWVRVRVRKLLTPGDING